MTSLCSNCTDLASARRVTALPAHLRLDQRGFARDPQTGSRLDRFTCGDCGTQWMLEIGPSEGVVDWYQTE